MAYNHKIELSKPERFAPGHRLCSGCGAGILCRAMTRALDTEDKAVIVNATGCLEVSSFLYPYTSWTDSYIHGAFENASAIGSGVEAAIKMKQQKGELEGNFKILVIGGDGGTYDIGFQSLSGAMERGTDMTYFCYDNEAYMNTGIQRSSSTPRFANATTTPAGTQSVGKVQNKKDLTEILAAHGAVSPECARAMAEGCAKAAGADIALSVTGIAGPDGGTPEKPVGLVYMAGTFRGKTEVEKHHFAGTRRQVREQAAEAALCLALRMLEEEHE